MCKTGTDDVVQTVVLEPKANLQKQYESLKICCLCLLFENVVGQMWCLGKHHLYLYVRVLFHFGHC